MIVSYEMRTALPFGEHTEWVEFCGEFADWQTFGRFVKTQSAYERSVRAVKEVGDGNASRSSDSKVAALTAQRDNWKKAYDTCEESLCIMHSQHKEESERTDELTAQCSAQRDLLRRIRGSEVMTEGTQEGAGKVVTGIPLSHSCVFGQFAQSEPQAAEGAGTVCQCGCGVKVPPAVQAQDAVVKCNNAAIREHLRDDDRGSDAWWDRVHEKARALAAKEAK